MSCVGKLVLTFGAASCLTLVGCSSRATFNGPVVKPIPLQQTDSGMGYSLNVGSFVTDTQQQGVTYTVVSGGGSFTGGVYSNDFATVGTYDVVFDVTDINLEKARDTFRVEVRTSNAAVVQVNGQSLQLLDTDTNKFTIISAATKVETFKTGLSQGQTVYERQDGADFDLFAFDTARRQTWTLGDSKTLVERYQGKTSTGQVVFTRGTATDTDLLIWNSATGMTKTISNVEGEFERNAMVNSQDLVFYERGNGGQADIWVYDPATDTSSVVSDSPNAESILGVLPDGAVVFSRLGGSGELDLFWFRRNAGLVEVGTDLGASVDTLNKTFHASTTTSQVVFSITTTPTSKSLYFWKAGVGTSAIDTNENLTYRAIGNNDVVAYTIEATAQDDVYAFDIVNGTPGTPITVSTNAATETVEDVAVKAGVAYVVYTRSGTPNSVHVYDVTTPNTVDLTNAAGIEYRATLVSSGDLVYRIADGSGVFHFDPTSDTSTSATTGLTGTLMDFAGEGKDPGDFVLTNTVSAQADLYLWDHSATGRVTVSNTAGNDAFQAMTSAGNVLFTRVITGNVNTDLFVFKPIGATETRLTAADGGGFLNDHAVVGSYSIDRR